MAPITPYLSDELYSRLSEKLSIFEFNNSLLESTYPTKEEFANLRDHELDTKMRDVIKVILSIRTLLANVSKKDNVEGINKFTTKLCPTMYLLIRIVFRFYRCK